MFLLISTCNKKPIPRFASVARPLPATIVDRLLFGTRVIYYGINVLKKYFVRTEGDINQKGQKQKRLLNE